MKTRAPVYAPQSVWGTEGQEYWRRRGGPGKSGSGPSGWKLKPAKVLARAMAEMAANYRTRKKNK